MDYRGRKYYLIESPSHYINSLAAFIKRIIPRSKIHMLPYHSSTPRWASKIIVSCPCYYQDLLEKVLSGLKQFFIDHHSWYYHYFYGQKRTKSNTIQFKEITKEDLGQ